MLALSCRKEDRREGGYNARISQEYEAVDAVRYSGEYDAPSYYAQNCGRHAKYSRVFVGIQRKLVRE